MDLAQLDNIHAGKRGFVIGGGSSIKDQDLSLLENEITVGCNACFEIIEPDYLVYLDKWFLEHFSDELCSISSLKFSHNRKDKYNLKPNRDDFMFFNYKKGKRVPKTFGESISVINNTGVTALRIAYLLGLDPIYSLGIDLNKKEVKKGNSNFHQVYPENRRLKKEGSIDSFLEEYRRTIKLLDVEVVSCSSISSLNSFIPFKPLEEVLQENQPES